MRLCVIVKQGRIMYATLVEDNHIFGSHGDHFHMRVQFRDDLDLECNIGKENTNETARSTSYLGTDD